MNQLARFKSTTQRLVLMLLVATTMVLFTASPAWAKPKKQEAAAAPTKSYVVPYMVVLAMIGVGLMTVCRPASRLEKPDDRVQKDDED